MACGGQLSKREFIAMQVFNAIANRVHDTPAKLPKQAVGAADALLEALEKK